MALDQFSILLDNPSMSYFPGQMVTGRVFIRSKSEKNTQGLKLKFEGKASVHWTVVHQESEFGDYIEPYDDSDIFFQFKSYLLGDGRSDVKLPAGETVYPFSFQLPLKNLPSSYLGQFGKVEYVLEAKVKRSSRKLDYHAKQHVTVNSIVDLNNDPGAAKLGEWKRDKTFCCFCCASGPLSMNVRISSRGFCSGEIIPLEVEINNLSTRRVADLSAELVQEATFFAQYDKKQSLKTLFSVNRGEPVDAGDSHIWRVEIEVPPVPPTKLGGCRIIDVQYVVKAEAHVSGVAFNLKESCPVIIGTIPLRAHFNDLQSPDMMPSAPPLFTPNGYPDLPPPQYRDSFNFKQEPQKPDKIVDNIAFQVIDQMEPSADPDYVPKYVSYGWKFHVPGPMPN